MTRPVDEGWLSNALGDGWLLKLVTLLSVPVSAAIGWAARRPLEAAGVRRALDESMRAHLSDLREDVARVRAERAADRAQCDRELAELRETISRLAEQDGGSR